MIRAAGLFLILILSASAASASAPDSATLDAGQIDGILGAAHAAAGGAHVDAFAAVTESGTLVQNGGPPSSFDVVADLRDGHWRERVVIGPATFLEGYDGTKWSEANGSLSIVSLPSFVADAVTQAYLGRKAYFSSDQRSTVTSGRSENLDGRQVYVLHVEPAGGSPAELYFDGVSYRLVRVIVQTALGSNTRTYSDFQTIAGVPMPLQQVGVNSSGTTTKTRLTAVKFAAAVDPADVARPAYVSSGQLAAPTSVPFVSDAAGTPGHIVVPVTVDGKQVSLFFDSGGGNFLFPATARRLGLHASGGLAVAGAGTAQPMAAFTAVSSVDFGGARLLNQNFIVIPWAYGYLHPRKDVTTEGSIGFELLANFRVIVRYADHRVDVAPFDESAPSGGVTLPFKSDGRHAYVLAAIDGVPGYYLLDTGNPGGIVLNLPFVQENHLFPNGGLTFASGGIGGGFPETLTAAKTFAFAGMTFNDVPVAIPQVKAGLFAARGVAGNLGSEFLSRFTVVFDYKAQTVTFIANRDVALPLRSDQIGLGLGQTDANAFEVRLVLPDSPAADAGIARGDRIVAFAGRQVSSGFGVGDFYPMCEGDEPFTVTVDRAGTSRTVTLTPRRLLPPAQ